MSLAEADLKIELSQNENSFLSIKEIEALVRDKTCQYEDTYLSYSIDHHVSTTSATSRRD
jgi:hypothetical protein